MGNRIASGIFASLALVSAPALPARAGTPFIVSGYWKWTQNAAGDPERHVRVSGDSGFYCVLDGKSSFAFDIGPDSLTTPMNGKNGVAWMPGSGDLIISGSEKGEPYQDRFTHSDSATYWNKCRAEELGWTPAAVRAPSQGSRAGGPGAAISGSRFPRYGWKTKAHAADGRCRPQGR